MNKAIVSFVFLLFCVCSQAARSTTVGSPVKAIYIDWHLNWGAPQQNVLDAVNAEYNVIILGYFLSDGTLADMAQAWAGLDDTTKINTINTAHSKGAVVLVSLGGSTDTPYGKDPAALGQAVGTWAVQQHLDGVDFELENIHEGFTFGDLNSQQLVNWIVTVTQNAYNAVGTGAIITHAPPAPYFGLVGASSTFPGPTGGYTAVYKQASSYISFFLVQFYDQGTKCYVDLFKNSGAVCIPEFSSTSVNEIAAAGVPLSKIVVGKPVTTADQSNGGWVSGSILASFFSQAQSDIGWNTGVMGWLWNNATTCSNWIKDIFTPAPCTRAHMRCTGGADYQTCVHRVWQPAKSCGSSNVCIQNGNYVRCVAPGSTTGPTPTPTPTPTSTPAPCTAGYKRCTGGANYQTCDLGVWQPAQSCTSPNVCSQSGNYVVCVAPTSTPTPTPGPGGCLTGDFRCGPTATQFQQCSDNVWYTQNCVSPNTCHTTGATINCY